MLDHHAPESTFDDAAKMRIGFALAASAVDHAILRLRRRVRIGQWLGVAAIAAAAVMVALADAATERWAAGIFGLQVAAFCAAVSAVERIGSWVVRRLVGPVRAAGLSNLVQGRYEDLLAEAGLPTGPLGAARIGIEALVRPSSLRRRIDRAADVIRRRSPELVAELSTALGAR